MAKKGVPKGKFLSFFWVSMTHELPKNVPKPSSQYSSLLVTVYASLCTFMQVYASGYVET